jgi:RNA polymerase sigma factor (sigma-70 family)
MRWPDARHTLRHPFDPETLSPGEKKVVPMSGAGSVSTCLELLKQGDDAAAALLFERYFRRLEGLARAKLIPLHRQVAADHEDVAQSAFNDFCQAVRTERYIDLHGRGDLRRVLAAFAVNKAKSLLDREKAGKRGSGAVRGESAFASKPDESGIGGGIDQIASPDTDPAMTAEFDDLLDRFHASLDEKQKEMAALMLEGHSSDEIGEKINMPASTVRRKLTIIRSLLAETFSGASGE